MNNLFALILTVLALGQVSAQCIAFQNCPNNLQACDYTYNNAQLWNESYWWDPLHQAADLADTPIDAGLVVVDNCSPANLNIQYLLFLDLDKNGTWETVVKSWEPPAPGTVNFNNANNPNYDGGDPRTFDERAVAATGKYQFAMETVSSGDTTRAYLRWNTQAAPNTFVNTELPYGTQKIKWLVGDDLGNNALCEYPIVAKDCKKPTVVCLNGLAVNIMPTEQITLWASDFLQYAEDNATHSNLIEIGIRKVGTGTGFPENPDGSPKNSLTFDCTEIGTQAVELWARDATGLADYCETYVVVQDNLGNCGGGNPNGAPTVVCINGLSVNVLPNGSVQLWAPDFLQYAEDDFTPANLLEFGLRKSGTGSGFPVDGNNQAVSNLLYNCNELGTNLVELWAKDLDGNANFCQTYIVVQDNLNHCNGGTSGTPTVVCLNGLSVNILPTAEITLWASDFLQYAIDDNTASSQLQLAIRRKDINPVFPVDGNGMPIESLTFDCTELGSQQVELWVKDLDGNTNYCETYVIVQDNFGACNDPMGQVNITTCIVSACNNAPIQGANLTVNGIAVQPIGPLDANGCALFPSISNSGPSFFMAPSIDADPLNGVTVFDLIKVKKFILGLESNFTPYELIAADANKSGNVSGFDMVELRKLILGINAELPNNTSWRFIDANFVFPNPQNPFQTAFPETISATNFQGNAFIGSFKAIKTGDLDCDALPGFGAPHQDRSFPQRSLTLPDIALQAGQTTSISLQMAEPGDWAGLQMSLQFDPEKVTLLETLTGDLPGLDNDAFYQPRPGILNVLWLNEQTQRIAGGQNLLELKIRAQAPINLSDVFHFNQDFENLGQLGDDAQNLVLNFRLEKSLSTGIATVLAPQPNPTSAGTDIPVQLLQAEQARVEVTDLSGKIIWTDAVSLEAGSHVLHIAPQAFPQPGIYLWRVAIGATSANGKLIRI